MRTTVTIDDALSVELMRFTRQETPASAIRAYVEDRFRAQLLAETLRSLPVPSDEEVDRMLLEDGYGALGSK